MIEAHRLVVEERGVERRREVHLQVRARVGEQREARRVRLREPVERERRDRRDDLVRRGAGDAVGRHALAQLALDRPHPALGPLEAERTPQLLGLPAGEARRHHRDPQQLLLEERHAERPLQDRLERGMGIPYRVAPGAAVEIRMHHLPDDRARPDDRHFHHQVVEDFRLEPRQRRHLRARLHLEDADRVGMLKKPVDGRIVGRDGGQLECRVPRAGGRGRAGGVDQFERILQGGHHAEAQQIHLHDAHVGAVVLVPLDDHAAGHGGGLERHTGVEAALTDHHAAGMLAEMAREILNLAPEPGEQLHVLRVPIEPDGRQVMRQRVVRISEFEVVHHLREPVHLCGVEAHHLPHLARGAPAAVGDDVGRHRRSEPAVLLVDVLDDALAPISAREIEVDVGPLAALLRQEALEEQIHPDRIDRRDPQAVADGAVGRRAAPLHEDAVAPAEVHQVPDDEEVAGELELLDEIELTRDLRARPVVVRTVALARADLGDLPEERRLRLALGHGIVGKAVAEIRERELQAVGQLARPGDGIRPIGEERRHLGRRLQVALRVGREAPAGAGQIGVMADARQHVEERPRRRMGEADPAGRHHRQVERRRQRDERGVVGFLVAPAVPLQLDVHAVAAEQADERVGEPADAEAAGVERRAPHERHEAARHAVEVPERERARPLRRGELHPRDEATEIPVPVLGFAEDGQRPASFKALGRTPRTALRPLARAGGANRQLRPDDRADAGGQRGLVEARCAVNAVAIEERECGIAELGGPVDERFRQRRALEKTERRGRVEFDETGARCHGPGAGCWCQVPGAWRRFGIDVAWGST